MKLVVDNYVGHPFRFCYNGIPSIQDAFSVLPSVITEKCEVYFDNTVGTELYIQLLMWPNVEKIDNIVVS